MVKCQLKRKEEKGLSTHAFETKVFRQKYKLRETEVLIECLERWILSCTTELARSRAKTQALRNCEIKDDDIKYISETESRFNNYKWVEFEPRYIKIKTWRKPYKIDPKGLPYYPSEEELYRYGRAHDKYVERLLKEIDYFVKMKEHICKVDKIGVFAGELGD